MTNTDTPRTDACTHCGGNWEKSIQLFACESTTEWRTDLCLEREKSKKLEAEVKRLKKLLSLEQEGHEATKKLCYKILDSTRTTPSRKWHMKNKKVLLK